MLLSRDAENRMPGRFSLLPLRSPTLPPHGHTNCVLAGHDRALVVDPGTSYPAELDRLRRALFGLRGRGGGIQAVLVTHPHADHACGAACLAGELAVPLCGHARTLQVLKERDRDLSGRVQLGELCDGEILRTDDDLELQVRVTPGHTPGHICLWDPAGRTLIGGDMVPGSGTTVISPPEGEMAAYLQSLRLLAELDPAWILPGHGPALNPGRVAILRLINHRLWRERLVREALGPGPRDLYLLTREAYPETSPLLLPLASRSALAHLIKLEREGRAFRVEGGRWVQAGCPFPLIPTGP